MVGPVHPGPEVFGWGDTDEFPEFVGVMWRVGMATVTSYCPLLQSCVGMFRVGGGQAGLPDLLA